MILTFNNSIKDGIWKSVSEKRLNEHDFWECNDSINLKWNVISEKNSKIGIVQMYIGKKILISNLTLTEWYLYQNKG